MATARPELADYCRHGWHLVPIPLGKKGPVTARWNTREMCVTDPDIAEWLDGNAGLAHAYSGTCAIDVDDLARATQWLLDRHIDLAALLAAPDAVRIESRPGRAKLIYRVARPLPSFKLGPLELRCASTSGLTVQDVLPPSVHPDTQRPYAWRYGSEGGHWSRLPPLPPQLANLWTSLIAPKGDAPKVAGKGKEKRKPLAEVSATLRASLELWDPDVAYDEWVAVGMAVHHETRGSPAGLALWNDWSSRGRKYAGIADLESHWRSFRLDHENPKTLASLRRETVAQPAEFPDMTGAPEAGTPPRAPPRALVPSAERDRDGALETLRSLRKTKQGTVEARISNVAAVLGLPELCGYNLAMDAYLDAIVVAPAGTDDWRPLGDVDYTELRVWLETAGNCEPIGHEMIRSAVHLVAEQQRRDSAQEWLARLQWDGVPRVASFYERYCGTDEGAYSRACSTYTWTALAGRILEPGCQADMVPVLIGKQGVGKSRGVQAMAPSMAQYAEVRVDEPDDVIARKMRGVVVAEMAEMRGMRATEVERVKAFVTRTHERWVPKYKEFATDYPRRFVIIGTTNDEEFLPVDTEHRRWLPLHTRKVDVAAIRADHEQLWAEGAVMHKKNGIAWRGLDQLAAPARKDAAGVDIWHDAIAKWVRASDAPYVKVADVLTEAVGLDARIVARPHELRAGRVLRALGYERKTVRDGDRTHKVWVFDPTS
jgi:predicted P-loop ATPase